MERLKSVIATVVGAGVALALFGLLAAFGLAAFGVLMGLGVFAFAALAIASLFSGDGTAKGQDPAAAE